MRLFGPLHPAGRQARGLGGQEQDGQQGPGRGHASTNAFLRGLTVGSLVAGGVAAAGAVLAVLFLPAQPVSLPAGAVERPEAAHEAAAQADPASAVQ